MLFWTIVVATLYAAAIFIPILNFGLIGETIHASFAGDISSLSTQEFAFALASAICALAIAFILAFGIMHAALVRLAIDEARKMVASETDVGQFARMYEGFHQRLVKHPFLGHAWREFDGTLVKSTDPTVIKNTVRPATFINIGNARERLFGLKMMGSISGYFVGVGLLLTFIGLVLALHKASAAVSSDDARGMQIATRELLQVATFKFATSIAGLGSSIMLSIFFRVYSIFMERGFDRFCHAVEDKVTYVAPQSIAFEMNKSLEAQLTELKQINSADFFARMGENISPQIQAAFTTAIAPVTASIDQALSRITESSQSGMSDLVSKFSASVQGSAGEQLRELAESLKMMQGALIEAQGGIGRTGEDFGRRMSEAAENLNRLVSEAGGRLNDSSEQSRTALMDVVGALRETFERANQKVDEHLGAAATNASGKVEDAMVRVMTKLETQVEGFREGLNGFHQGMSQQLTETNTQVTAARTAAVGAVAAASTEAALALQTGLAGAMQLIRGELEQFAATIRNVEIGMSAQVNAIRDATSQSRLAADAFGKTAEDVRAASTPMLQSGDKIAGATQKMTETVASASERMSSSMTDASAKLAESVTRSVAKFEEGQTSAREFSGAMKEHIEKLSGVWTGYAAQFERVDKELAQVVESLASATRTQGEQLGKYASDVDGGLAKAIDRLTPFLAELKSNTEDFGEEVSKLKSALMSHAEA